MQTLKPSQQLALWARVGLHLVTGGGAVFGSLVHLMRGIAVVYQEPKTYERSLPLEERLQRTGRVRYR
jgi:hypothetical protein